MNIHTLHMPMSRAMFGSSRGYSHRKEREKKKTRLFIFPNTHGSTKTHAHVHTFAHARTAVHTTQSTLSEHPFVVISRASSTVRAQLPRLRWRRAMEADGSFGLLSSS